MAIISGTFESSYKPKDAKPRRPLNVGCSGGGGHNAANEGVECYLRKELTGQVEFVKHKPEHPKEDTEVTKIRLGSKVLSTWLGKLIKHTSIPVLPNIAEIEREVVKLRGNNKKDRNYVDMLLDVYPSGYYGAAVWNVLQSQDQTNELKKLIAFQESSDSGNHATVVAFYLNKLKDAANNNKPYTEIISTQAMALPALCEAVIQYNKWLKENNKNHPEVEIHQYMTDLPTNGAVHFFPALARLTEEQAKVMKLYAVDLKKEVLDKNLPNHEDFAGLYSIDPKTNPMVRLGFKNLVNDKSNDFDKECTITYQDESGKDQNINVPANKKTACVMLGSQAGEDTIKYTKTLVELGYQVFVFGGTKENISAELDKIKEADEKIITLAKQNDGAITQIMTRSNVIVTRSGGLSAMEQMAMPHNPEKQTIFIHHADNDDNILSSGIEWEDANADGMIDYLHKNRVTVTKTMPKLIGRHLHRSFDKEILDASNSFSRDLTDCTPFMVDIALNYRKRAAYEESPFASVEDWYEYMKGIYANKKHLTKNYGRPFWEHACNAGMYYGLHQFTLTQLTNHLESKNDVKLQSKLLEYITLTKKNNNSHTSEDLNTVFTKQVNLYQRNDQDPYQELCRSIQSLIINTHWKWGLGNRTEVGIKNGIGKSRAKIPSSMITILKYIKEANKSNDEDSWKKAIRQIKTYIQDNDLNKDSTFRYAKTTCAYQFFHNQIKKLEPPMQQEIPAIQV